MAEWTVAQKRGLRHVWGGLSAFVLCMRLLFLFLRKSFCCLAAHPVVFKSIRQQVMWTVKVHVGDKTLRRDWAVF